MRYLVVISVLLLAESCSKTFFPGEDDELTLERMPFTGNELRIDGYYYFPYGNPERWSILFLYSNGICLYGNAILESEIENQEERFANGEFYEFAATKQYGWGVFQIDGNVIKEERWHPPSPYSAYIREGNILNDTTFRITQAYRMVDGKKTEVRERDRLFHFKQFSPKPDSTNSFIK